MFNPRDQQKVVSYLISAEKLAGEILADREEIIQLDNRRNQNRQALRDLKKTTQDKCWVTVGSVLVKHNVNDTTDLLLNDQKQLNIDINKIRSDIKVKYNELRDLEMRPPVPGMMLVPMTHKESDTFKTEHLFKY